MVILFAIVMQQLWVYMDDIMGKGLSNTIILQYLLNSSVISIPIALPLALLLTGIMTFGSLGENFELAAIKSAGISLNRFMRPMTIFSIVMCGFSFYTNNFIVPSMNLKTLSLLYDIRQQKPTMTLKEGLFNNSFENYIIKIDKKSDDGRILKNIILYDHTSGLGNKNVVVADSGHVYTTEDNNYIVFELYKGWRYEESGDLNDLQFNRMYFENWNKIFDMSHLKFERTDEDLFKNNEKMMNVFQINDRIDSMEIRKNLEIDKALRLNKKYLSISDSLFYDYYKSAQIAPLKSYDGYLINTVDSTQKNQVLTFLDIQIKASKSILFNINNEHIFQKKKLIKLKIERNQKYTFAIACVIFMLIGAPMGGIIRKGGIGMPIVVGLVFFVVYFILTSTGKNLAEQEKISVFNGTWMSTLILVPFAVFILIQANRDSTLVNKDTYIKLWDKIKNLFRKEKP